MLRVLADENFNRDILRGILRRRPQFDVLRAQDVGLSQAPDPDVLAWAAQEGRITLSHDVTTMTQFAAERLQRNEPMPGPVPCSPTGPGACGDH
jgi:predicted nuclease of predicted toxin-antitoxin system